MIRPKSFGAVLIIVALTISIYVNPQGFMDLWLSRDQQGSILFSRGHYVKASQKFSDVEWQAYSLYGAEEFGQSAILYNQFSHLDSLFSHANALAHAGEYVASRDNYQRILSLDSTHSGATHNIVIVQKLIDEINVMSESQLQEQGDNPKELGDNPKRADGADKKEFGLNSLEQLTADQLLLDPELNAMWLRQVQKDPAKFLTQKFYMQLQLRIDSEDLEPSPASGAQDDSI